MNNLNFKMNTSGQKSYDEPILTVLLLPVKDVIFTSDENQGEWDPQGEF